MAEDLFAAFERLDEKLVAAGFHRTSTFWRATVERFLHSGRRTAVWRVGRRGGKSSTLCRLAVVLALFVDHPIPAGDVGIVAFVSTRRDEAAARLFTIARILDALGIRYEPRGDALDVVGRPIRFQVFPCTIAAVSGFTSIAVIADEVAKWRDAETGSNPATEVLAALRPTTATQPHARIILSSSPLGTEDAHAVAFDRGDTETQITAFAPTWIANATITEAATKELEPDERVRLREYGAVPSASVNAAFDVEHVSAAYRDVPERVQHGERVLVIDASSGRNDDFTGAILSWAWTRPEPEFEQVPKHTLGGAIWTWAVKRDARGEPIKNPKYSGEQPVAFLHVEAMTSFRGSFHEMISGRSVVAALAEFARRYNVRFVHGDQRESLMLTAEWERLGFRYLTHTWTNPAKVQAVEIVRGWFRDRRIVLPGGDEGERLRRELLAFRETITPSGYLTYAGRQRAKDDRVALLLTAAMADAMGGLPGSPIVATATARFDARARDFLHQYDRWERGMLGADGTTPAERERIESAGWHVQGFKDFETARTRAQTEGTR